MEASFPSKSWHKSLAEVDERKTLKTADAGAPELSLKRKPHYDGMMWRTHIIIQKWQDGCESFSGRSGMGGLWGVSWATKMCGFDEMNG